MKQQVAKLNYLKMAPRKVRLIANLVKKMPVEEAKAQLILNPKRASEPILRLLRSAIANAKSNKMNPDALIIKEITVNGGPMLKRWLPRAQGRATPLQKKSSHITIVLTESEKTATPRFKIEERVLEKKTEIAKKKSEKMKKYEKYNKREHDHEHNHEQEHKEEKKKKSSEQGLVKRMFRRKAI
ncbi:MAG: 50S ribosomal protein L22 [Patescibacteria group bacterium]|nr:50S ribosomal protein L22 [Patescibacteria group bacterium]